MEATVGGRGGILLDPSLETGRGEEQNLEFWRLKFEYYQRQEQERSKNKQKRRLQENFSESHEEGNSKGEDLQLANIPKLGEKWDIM